MAEMTKGKFGFHRGGSEHESSTAAAYVGELNRAPALQPTARG
jgi:hypothetical protein